MGGRGGKLLPVLPAVALAAAALALVPDAAFATLTTGGVVLAPRTAGGTLATRTCQK